MRSLPNACISIDRFLDPAGQDERADQQPNEVEAAVDGHQSPRLLLPRDATDLVGEEEAESREAGGV